MACYGGVVAARRHLDSDVREGVHVGVHVILDGGEWVYVGRLEKAVVWQVGRRVPNVLVDDHMRIPRASVAQVWSGVREQVVREQVVREQLVRVVVRPVHGMGRA